MSEEECVESLEVGDPGVAEVEMGEVVEGEGWGYDRGEGERGYD